MKQKILFISISLIIGLLLGWLFFHQSVKTEVKSGQVNEKSKPAIWTCAMHPQIRMAEPGKCPICGMDLIPLGQNNTSTIDTDAIHLSMDAAQLANVLTTVVTKNKPYRTSEH